MKEMTADDELAILREVAATLSEVVFKDIELYEIGGRWHAHRKEEDGSVCIIQTGALAKCIFQARQKLAAEREATMSPNERKYRAALEEITHQHCDAPTKEFCQVSVNIARNALKE